MQRLAVRVPDTMRAMTLVKSGGPLERREVDLPRPTEHQVLLHVRACGVCRTDLHIIDGELTKSKLPLIPGHEIVGTVVEMGSRVERFRIGDRIGVPWLGHTCGRCRYCLRGDENLCDTPEFTGYTINGGYAEYAVADARYCLPIPESFGDCEAAPLLCAGLIGYRAYRMLGECTDRIGIYGFGGAAHFITQIAVAQGRRVYAFTRTGDTRGQEFARSLGAVWAGDSTEAPPEELDGAIIFAPVGSLIVTALEHVGKGGRVVSGGIHMSDIPSFPYRLLWGERSLRSVANLSRTDGEEFMRLVQSVPIRTTVHRAPLELANEVLNDFRQGKAEGAYVLEP